MKYYIVITPFFPTEESFRGSYIFDQVRAIEKTGRYKVVVFKSADNKIKKKSYEYQGITVYIFSFKRIKGGLLNNLLDGINKRLFLEQFTQTRIKVSDVAFVHCHCSNNVIYGLGLRSLNSEIKVLLQHHDLDPLGIHLEYFRFLKWNTRFKAWRKRVLFEQVDVHVCISQWVKEYLYSYPEIRKGEVYQPFLHYMQMVKGTKSINIRNSYVLYNGVDLTIFHPMIGLKKKDVFTIGCIANFQELKQHITLLKAVDILVNSGYKNLRLRLIGTGETLRDCESFVYQHCLDMYVSFEKEVAHERLSEYYNSLDLFVLPSVFEGFGCVYTEAAACGVPFIGVFHQGAAEIIDPMEYKKWLIEPYDYNSLAMLIAEYYEKRCPQKLCKTIEINTLIIEFLNYIEKV